MFILANRVGLGIRRPGILVLAELMITADITKRKIKRRRRVLLKLLKERAGDERIANANSGIY